MDTVILIVGWVLWSLMLLYGIGFMLSGNPDGGVRHMMRTQGFVTLLACALTAFLPISKFWVLLAIPIGFLLPTVLMGGRVKRGQKRAMELMRESERTGVPFADLLNEETERMKGNR